MPTEPGSDARTAGRKGGFRQQVLVLVIAVLGSLMLMTACSSEAGSGAGGGTEEPAPPATEAPAAPETPDSGGSGGETTDGLSSEDWLLIAVLDLGAAAVLFLITSMASNRSRKKDAARSSLNHDLDRVIGGARWVHDQGSLDVLSSTSPEQLRTGWMLVRDRIVDLEGQTATVAAGASNSNLERSLSSLGRCLAGLRSALESSVSARLDPSGVGQEDRVAASSRDVYARRTELMAAIEPVAAARR